MFESLLPIPAHSIAFLCSSNAFPDSRSACSDACVYVLTVKSAFTCPICFAVDAAEELQALRSEAYVWRSACGESLPIGSTPSSGVEGLASVTLYPYEYEITPLSELDGEYLDRSSWMQELDEETFANSVICCAFDANDTRSGHSRSTATA